MTLEIEIPDSVLGIPAYSRQDLMLDVAVSLYQRGLYSLQNAARFAGMTTSRFQQVLDERKIVVGTPSADEATNTTQPAAELATIPPEMIRPTRPQLVLEDLIKEQNFKGMDINRLNRTIDKMDVQEPVELLLSQLTP